MKDIEYPFSIKPLSSVDGGGFIIEFPDLPGCVSDGNTIEEAIANGKDAVKGWLETCKALGREIPIPSQESSFSGKILLRLPKYLHEKLFSRSKLENVSLNSLIQTFLAEGLASKNTLGYDKASEIKNESIVPAAISLAELILTGDIADNSTAYPSPGIFTFAQETKH